MTFSSQEKHLLLCSYFRAHPTTLLLKILEGTDAWAVPTSNFGGTVPQVPPRSPPLLHVNAPLGEVAILMIDILMHRDFVHRGFVIAVSRIAVNNGKPD